MDINRAIADTSLANLHKAALTKGNIHTIADLFLKSIQDISQKCKISIDEVKQIIGTLSTEAPLRPLVTLDETKKCSETFTTGDANLDRALGGGIKTGMIWEIVGESAAGKTQFGLQLSLCVQIPKEHGGLSGTACYLTTSSKLSTKRLLQIRETHDLLSKTDCCLENVHTISTPTVPVLLHVLSKTLPAFIKQNESGSSEKPVKLLVIDALAELFHNANKTTKSTLVERSQIIVELSLLLHSLASDHSIAILVLNEVIDNFNKGRSNVDDGQPGLLYSEQSRWFATGHSVPGEDRKEAALGLSWANQVNVRILVSRTSRRRFLETDEHDENDSRKRRRTDNHGPVSTSTNPDVDPQSTLIRRLNVLFSSVSKTASLDYIVTPKGVVSLAGEDTHPLKAISLPKTTLEGPKNEKMAPELSNTSNSKDAEEGDEWDHVWADNSYDNVDWDALELQAQST